MFLPLMLLLTKKQHTYTALQCRQLQGLQKAHYMLSRPKFGLYLQLLQIFAKGQVGSALTNGTLTWA